MTTAVKERPILFSGPMVRAILDGRKTQTRRVMKRNTPIFRGTVWDWFPSGNTDFQAISGEARFGVPSGWAAEWCPYGQPGDRLWVRETFSDPFPLDVECKNFTGFFRASDPDRQVKWKPSIFMPRWASRITLDVTEVRVERLREITPRDAYAEGARCSCISPVPACKGNIDAFRVIWESINGEGSWDLNPWLWIISFRRLEAH